MAERTSSAKAVTDWKGLFSNLSPHEVQPGSFVELVNMQVLKPGVLSCRKGYQPATFSNAAADTAYHIIAMARFQTPEANFVIYQDSSGLIKAGKDPS